MANRYRRIRTLCLVLSTLFLLQACAEVDANLKKMVVIKYAHLANVGQFQGAADGVHQSLLVGVNPGSFWAIFDVCSIDVQGSGLAGMQYDASKFVAEAGSGSYGPSDTLGVVNVASVPMPSESPPVRAALKDAFSLGPASQYFPKGFYPTLKSRIAIFVREAPVGYRGDAMGLRYNGQPDVAALVQNAGDNNPAAIPFYMGKSAIIASTCPW
jgi:hypothetical protein